MTLDQIYLLIADKERLKLRKYSTGTPEQLVARGIVPSLPGGARSYVQMIRMQKSAEKKATEKANRRLRKEQKRLAAIEYKRRLGQLPNDQEV